MNSRAKVENLGRDAISAESMRAQAPSGPQSAPPSAGAGSPQTGQQAEQQPGQQQGQQTQAGPSGAGAAPTGAQPAPQVTSGYVVVLDPGHGGTDTGARGDNGAVEKDVVLQFARSVRSDLQQQGFRVLMTRNDDSNPSYDDRAAMANAYRQAVFISLHVASTGAIGTARAYYYRFWSQPPVPPPSGATASGTSATGGAGALLPWEEAQRPYQDTSRRLADILQSQLAQAFMGSPATSMGVAERELRSVVGPAVAVEVSSVSVPDPKALAALAYPLGSSIAKGVATFRAAGMK